MVFQGRAEEGQVFVRGGRYDNLLEKFGKAAPAVGFSLDIDGLLAALERQKVEIPQRELTKIVYHEEDLRDAIAEARVMRKEGHNVTLLRKCGKDKLRIIELTEESKKDIQDILHKLLQRGLGQHAEQEWTVAAIVAAVRERGDAALFDYTREFDKCTINADNIQVSGKEIAIAYMRVSPKLVAMLKRAAANITAFHEKQRQYSWFDYQPDGSILGQKVTPLDSAGIYVPGGKAAYPSSVLMNIIPARVAGVERVVVATPPNADGTIADAILVAADIAGGTDIYKMGGAQAIAALAYGTDSVPRVDKITGPGNIYVTLAKKACFGQVGLDSLAGPSEILVLADETADPGYVAADLLSQAEHDELASAILVTDSKELAEKVAAEVDRRAATLPRRNIIEASLAEYGYILLVENMAEAIALTNELAAEHVEILTRDPFAVLPQIRHAGAVFLGEYSPEPLGDYYAGPNHTIPTGGTARFFSPLGVDAFVKKSNVIAYTAAALAEAGEDIALFARSEGLEAHAEAVEARRSNR
jgi:histidinol dehydrogenase